MIAVAGLSEDHRMLARLIATGAVYVIRAELATPSIDHAMIEASAIASLKADYIELPREPREPWRRGRPLRHG